MSIGRERYVNIDSNNSASAPTTTTLDSSLFPASNGAASFLLRRVDYIGFPTVLVYLY